jgi:multimeric flavodoxin WrbA
MKVVAFNGSPKKRGNTSILLNLALEELNSEGIETELIHIGEKPIQGCRACFRCAKNQNLRCALEDDPLNDYMAKMLEADGMLLGSPTYFSDITANMKALIERCGMVSGVNGHALKRKVGAAVIAVRRAGSVHAFSSINFFFLISQMIIPASSYWNMAIGLNPGDVEQDAEGIQTVKTLGQNMAWLLKKIHA